MVKFTLQAIDRITFIWARYSGIRDETKYGKHFSKSDVEELIRRLNKFKDNPQLFDNGFEKDGKGQSSELGGSK